MWNQIVFNSRPIFTNHLHLLRNTFHHTRGTIVLTYCHNPRLINHLTYHRSQLITLLPKHFSSSTSNSTVASKTHENIEDKGEDSDGKSIIDEETLDKLYDEMDQRIADVNQFIQSNSRTRQYKVYGLSLITVIAGVFAGAYTAHFGAWFLDKVGLFIFEEDDDDD